MFIYSLSGLELAGSGAPIAVEIEDNETTARTAVYQTLGRLFLEPDDSYWELASDGRWAKELASAGTLLPYDFDAGDQPVPAERSVLESEHATLFGMSARSGAWAEDDDRNHDEVVRFYEYFGLSSNGEVRPVDHIATECDFLQFVTYKEAAATSDRLRGSFRRAQLDFLDRQVSMWLPRYLADASAQSPSPFAAWVLGELEKFVAADHAYVRELVA